MVIIWDTVVNGVQAERTPPCITSLILSMDQGLIQTFKIISLDIIEEFCDVNRYG